MSIGFLDPGPSIPDTSGLYRKIKEQQAEIERLQADLDFYTKRICAKCGTPLGLLADCECPLCRARAEEASMSKDLEECRSVSTHWHAHAVRLEKDAERLQAKLAERGERMQIMYEALVSSGSSNRIPEIHKWFDNGEPK